MSSAGAVLWAAWRRSDRGSMTAEMTLIAPVLIMAMVFIGVVIHRNVETRLRLNDAAHQATRAAAMERTFAAAMDAAQDTAASALASAGTPCGQLTITGDEVDLLPGGRVTLTLRCSVDLDGALVVGVPGSTQLTATATEPVDSWRSVGRDGASS